MVSSLCDWEDKSILSISVANCTTVQRYIEEAVGSLTTLWERPRILITRDNVWWIAIPPLSLYLFQCYLVRRPGTYPLRLAIMPILVPWLIWPTFGVLWFPERTMAWNVPFTTTGALFILRALEYSLVPAGRLKLGEHVPGEHHLDLKTSVAQKVAWGLLDSIELCVSQRGIGWDFGTGEGLRLPPMQASRPIHNRLAWLRTTLLRDVLVNYLVVDIINTWWRTIPQISSPLPSEKAFHELPIPLRYAVPGTVMVVVATYMSLGYEVAAVLDVIILGREPSAWPVLFGEPWKAQSLHDLWAKEWHQLSRRTFLYSLGYPLRALFGTPGMMMGAFIASGLYHNLMLIGDGQSGLDIPTMSFFVAQGIGVISERLFRQITGRKVGGLLGNLWVIAFLLVTVQPFAAAWINRGYLETSPIPPAWSLTQRIVDRVF